MSAPFLYLTGCKTRMLPALRARLPPLAALGAYTEPFLGTGALFLDIADQLPPTCHVTLADANPWFVVAWRAATMAPEATIAAFDGLAEAHMADPDGTYAAARAHVNRWPVGRTGGPDRLADFNRDSILAYDQSSIGTLASRGALAIYLSRTGFNGLWRVNRRGEFNVPSRGPLRLVHPGANIRAAATLCARFAHFAVACLPANWTIMALNPPPGASLIYADPPYDAAPAAPGGTASHTAYTAEGFTAADQRILAEVLALYAARGAHVVASNADTPAIRDAYAEAARSEGAQIHTETVSVRRSVSRDAATRGATPELIVSLAPQSGALPGTLADVFARESAGGALHRPPDALRSESEQPAPPLLRGAAPPRRETRRSSPMPLPRPLTITRVRSNLHAGVDVALGDKTLLLMPNGIGKTAVLRSIELALTGRASDIAGREDVGQPADLMALAPGRRGDLWADVEFSDGSHARWETRGGAGRAQRPIHTLPDHLRNGTGGVLTIRELRDILRGSADTARRAFLGVACATASTATIEALIPAPLLAHFQSARGQPAASAVDDLIRAREEAARRKREEQAGVRAAEAILATMTGALAPVSAEDVADAEAHAADAARIYGAAVQNAMRARGIVAAREEGRLLTAQRGVTPLVLLVAGLPTDAPVRLRRAEALAVIADHHATHPEIEDCVACGQFVPAHRWPERLGLVRGAIDRLRAALSIGGNTPVAAVSDTDRRLAMVRARLAELRDDGSPGAAQRALAATDAENACADDHRAAVQRVASLRAAQAQRAQLTDARAATVARAQEAETWGHVVDACDTAIRDVLEGGVAGFCAKVQRALPGSDVFDLRLREGAREVFAFGLLRTQSGGPAARGAEDAVLHTALSGAEWARVTAAMAAAIVPTGSRFAMLIPEDRAFDAVTLAATMRALSVVPWQVVWASPVRPQGRTPAGWAIVESPTAAAGALTPSGSVGAEGDDLTYTDGSSPAGLDPDVVAGLTPPPEGLNGLILA